MSTSDDQMAPRNAVFQQKHLDRLSPDLQDHLTPELVREVYSILLARPATKKEVRSHWRLRTVGALRDILLRSDEFRRVARNLIPAPRPSAGDTGAMKTIFLHIPKTGGTTVHEALKPFFDASLTCPERHDGLNRYAAGELATYRFFSGHFSLQSCALIPGPKRIFTMLRHPASRLVSQYNFLRAHTREVVRQDDFHMSLLARRHDINEYFSLKEVRRHPSVNNLMVRTLTSTFPGERWERAGKIAAHPDAMPLLDGAIKNLRSLHAFGILERFQESIDLITHALGFPAPTVTEPKMVLKALMGADPRIEKIEPQAGDAATLKVIASLIQADLGLYQYALKLFGRRIKARSRQSTSRR